MTKKETPSQTVGPYFAYGLTPNQYGYELDSIASPVVDGDPAPRIHIEGRVFDGNGAPVDDAMIEIWQADSEGRYAHPADRRNANTGFRGFGRCGTGTDAENRFFFETVKPGSVDGRQAPHITVIVFMRGMLKHTYTRLYFPEESEANAKDPVLQLVPQERRDTLIAQRLDGPNAAIYLFDIHMQGEKETIFFEF